VYNIYKCKSGKSNVTEPDLRRLPLRAQHTENHDLHVHMKFSLSMTSRRLRISPDASALSSLHLEFSLLVPWVYMADPMKHGQSRYACDPVIVRGMMNRWAQL